MHWADGSNAEPVKCICEVHADVFRFFCINYSQEIYHEYLSYVPTDGDFELVEGTVLWIELLEAWVGTIVECLTEREACGGKQQKEYTEIFAKHLQQASNQINGEFWDFVAQKSGEELGI